MFVPRRKSFECLPELSERLLTNRRECCDYALAANPFPLKPEVGKWRVLISTNDILNNHKSVSIIKAINFNYVYCFPYKITIADGTYRCPIRMFKVPIDLGFTTLNKTVLAVKRKLHILSDVDKLFIDDVHIGHFPNSSVATTGIEMYERIQEPMKEVSDFKLKITLSRLKRTAKSFGW